MSCKGGLISCKHGACSSCVALGADAGHFTLWLQAAKADCQKGQCSGCYTACLQEKAGPTHKKPAARLPDIKGLIFVFSIVLSSRICGGGRSQEQLFGKHVLPCGKGIFFFFEKLLGSVWLWGAACAALLLMLLFPPLLLSHELMPAVGDGRQVTTASHKRSNTRLSHYMNKASLSVGGIPSLLAFQEAPPFRNQMGCPLAGAGKLVEAHVCDPSSVHILMTLDGAYLRGSIAAVFSILQHATCPENVVFHFLVTEYHGYFRALMRSTFPALKFKIYHFEASVVRERISSSVRQALEQPLNYARNYMADMLEPCVRRVIYLDSDLVVVDDIFKLWTTKLGSHIVAAPEYCHANFSKYFSSSFWDDSVLARTFDGRKPCYFNTGVMVIDLHKWRQQNCTKKIEHWMQVQKERRIYELGSLPPFLLVFAGAVEPVDHRWNQHGLGGDNVKGSCRPLHMGPVSLLHWSGEGKPWARLDSRHPCPLDSLWAPFDLYVTSIY